MTPGAVAGTGAGTDAGTDRRRAVYPMYQHHTHHSYTL